MCAALTIRSALPVRSAVAGKTKYTLYRTDLRRDFLQACGYCGDSDERIDHIGFHIDHFAPQALFPTLALVYQNLVYACRFCNVSKSDHWIGKVSAIPNNGAEGFVDPCTIQYEQHLERLANGQIVGRTDLGKYVVRRLKLHLLRHELLWNARRTRAMRDDVDALIETLEKRGQSDTPEAVDLLKRFRELTKSIEDYEFRANN
jgi:uncharacterized protein (TIGR02646 family)